MLSKSAGDFLEKKHNIPFRRDAYLDCQSDILSYVVGARRIKVRVGSNSVKSIFLAISTDKSTVSLQ